MCVKCIVYEWMQITSGVYHELLPVTSPFMPPTPLIDQQMLQRE